MKKQYFFLVIILMLGCFAPKVNAQVQAIARLDSSVMRIGAQTHLHFSVHQPVKAKVNFPQLTDTINAKVLVLGSSKRDTVADKGDPKMITVHQSYTITAFDEGTYPIPAFEFGTSGGVVKTQPLSLDIRTIKVDTTKAIYDIKQPLAVSYTLWDWLRDNWILVCSILAVLLIIGGVIWYIKTRPKKQEVVIKEVIPELPLHVIYLNKLQELRDRKLWQQGDVKLYHSEISDIIREYIEMRYVIKTHEKTTDEIFASIKYIDINEEGKNLLRQILILADLVKFAKETPLPHENEQSIDNAVAFVNKTKQVFEPIKPTEGGGHANTHV